MPRFVVQSSVSRKKRAVLAVGLTMMAGTALMGAAVAQDAPPEFAINVSGWEGGARARSDAGDFSHCDVRRAYDQDRILVVSLNRRNEINIGLVDPTFEFSPQTGTSTVLLQIDQSLNARIPAAPGGETILVLAAGDTDELLQAMRRGNVMFLETEYGAFQFPLSGTMNAFGALTECIRVANEILPPEPEPEEVVGDGPAGIGRNAMAALLQAAGIEGALLVPQEQLPVDEMELSQIWLIGEVVGGLHQRQRTGGEIEIDAFVEDYLGILDDRCNGTFSFTPDETEVLDNRYAFAPVDMVCSGDEGTSAVTAIFVLDDNFYSVFFHEGDQAIVAEVEVATDAVAALVRQLAVDSLEAPGEEGEAPPADPDAVDPEAPVSDGETPDSEAPTDDEPSAEEPAAELPVTDEADQEADTDQEPETTN